MTHRPKLLAAGLAAGAVATAVLALPAEPASALGAGTYAYVTNSTTNQESVVVVDTATGSTAANIPVDAFPNTLVASPDGTRAYVAEDGEVQVIDTTQESVVATITPPVTDAFSELLDLALSPDGKQLYVVDFHQDVLLVIDTATHAITATIPVGHSPAAVVATATQVYVADYDDGTVSVIDAATRTVSSTIDVGAGPTGLALVPAAGRLYVAANDGGKVVAVNTASNSVTGSVPAAGAYQLAVSPDGSRVYASVDDGILVLDSATGTALTTISSANRRLADVAVGPDGRIYDQGSDPSGATLEVYDPTTFTKVSTSTFQAISNSVTIGSIAPAPSGRADLQAKISGPVVGRANTAYTYTVTVKNAGPGSAMGVGAGLLLPPRTTLVSASGSYVQRGQLVLWRGPSSLAPNASASFQATVRFTTKGAKVLLGGAWSNTQDTKPLNNIALGGAVIG